jgi:hypothetical protein
MEYSYTINESSKSLDVVVSGQVDSAAFTKLGIKIRTLALELGYAILFDYRNAKVNISIGEVYFWFRDHLDKVSMKFRSIPTAHLTNENNAQLFRFADLTWSNTGVVVKSFNDPADAKNWLGRFNQNSTVQIKPLDTFQYEQLEAI